MLTRNLDKAREAYKNKDVEASIEAHKGTIRDHEEKHKTDRGKYIKSIIYGGLDGIITTFAVVAGVAGAELSTGVVLILGFANLVADGLSMGIGDFLSTKAELEYEAAERERERWEMENYPEGEKLEMIEIYMNKGVKLEDAETVVNTLSKYEEAWLDTMMMEELGIIEEEDISPAKNGFVTFLSFALFGFVPLSVFILANYIPFIKNNTFTFASIFTGITLFILGALKVNITDQNWFLSGLEMLLVGGIAAASAYGIGVLLSGLA